MMDHYFEIAPKTPLMHDSVDCHWPSLKKHLLGQWKKVSQAELDEVGPKRHGLAMLIQKKYGVSWQLVEDYLANIERTLPLFG